MTKKNLPIDRMSEERFYRFKKRCLDKDTLNAGALRKIERLFDLDPNTTEIVSVNCDEAHGHNYECLDFDNRTSAVVSRLIDEI